MSSLESVYFVLFFEALAPTYASGTELQPVATLCFHADRSCRSDWFGAAQNHVGAVLAGPVE